MAQYNSLAAEQNIMMLNFNDLSKKYDESLNKIGQFVGLVPDQPIIDIRQKKLSSQRSLLHRLWGKLGSKAHRPIEYSTVAFRKGESNSGDDFFRESGQKWLVKASRR